MSIFSHRISFANLFPLVLLLAGALFLTVLTACGDGDEDEESTSESQQVYVDVDATGAGNGSSWADAFTTVQAGVDAASSGDAVWVRQGTYRAASATATVLAMKDGVAVYGGFAGTETALAQRSSDPALTILSGDQAANDPTLTDNSYQVVQGASNAALDGLTITAGNAVGAFPAFRGAGMYNDSVTNLEVVNVTFSGNSASSGAGMYNGSVTNLEIVNVAFIGNTAGSGGGMFNDSVTNLEIVNVAFIGNSATNGGGMQNILSSSSPALTNVTFIGNSATNGGGMYNGSAADSSFFSSPALSNVTFSGNSATNGGGMFNWASSPALSSVTFSGNMALDGGGMYNQNFSSPALSNVTFSGNTASDQGGGMRNSGSSPALTNVTFSTNSALNSGGGIYNDASSTALSNVAFWGNTGTGLDVVDQGGGTSAIAFSCAEQDLSGYDGSNVLLSATPFAVAASGEIFLDQGSPCVDAGSETAANDGTTGFTAMGLPDWWAMTTSRDDAALDADDAGTTDVDIGRHYDPDQAWIKTASADAADLSWTTNGATACEITNDADATTLIVADADLDSGSTAHGQGTGVVLTMTCQGAVGLSAAAEVTVP